MATLESLEKAVTEGFKAHNERFENLEKQIDALAQATANGFIAVHKEMDERFKQVDERFDIVDQRLERVERNTNNLVEGQVVLEGRVTKLESAAV